MFSWEGVHQWAWRVRYITSVWYSVHALKIMVSHAFNIMVSLLLLH